MKYLLGPTGEKGAKGITGDIGPQVREKLSLYYFNASFYILGTSKCLLIELVRWLYYCIYDRPVRKVISV